MVKYVTKEEIAGNWLSELYNSVILHSDDADSPTKNLRSLMLKSVADKRYIGQCEVSRLLLSEPLYSSSFEFVNISLKLCQDKQLFPITAETEQKSKLKYKYLSM